MKKWTDPILKQPLIFLSKYVMIHFLKKKIFEKYFIFILLVFLYWSNNVKKYFMVFGHEYSCLGRIWPFYYLLYSPPPD